jgi:hypothetical protein
MNLLQSIVFIATPISTVLWTALYRLIQWVI